MSVNWTKEQAQVIALRDRNILVSAAAGSGKTAVLVERIIGRILDEKQPVDIDKMLIVTFTSAAASEMRERISAAIETALEKNPSDSHLQKQATLVHHAQITTIHSFCLYLIRNYFHRIDLEPNFRIAEEGELNLLREDVVAEVLNENYEAGSEAFISFVECFATGKKDDVLREYILKLYHFAMSYPWPKEWLGQIVENYQFTDFSELSEKSWMQSLMKYLEGIWQELLDKAEENRKLTLEEDGPTHANAVADHDKIRLEHLAECKDYASLAQQLEVFSFDRLPSSRGYEGSLEKLDWFKEQREEIKSTIKKVKEQFFFASADVLTERMKKMEPIVGELVRLTESFIDKYEQKKREKNILDFDDLEHFALKILLDEETKESTEVAVECRKLFEEVMVDEYQDSNFVQESLLSAVSKEAEGGHNRFMVGDVKQSIYRFRLARPELFMDKYDSYTTEESVCQKIELHQNFRSRREVLEFTNDIFYKIMQKDLGNVAYDEAAALYPGASYPENDTMQAELLLADSEGELLEDADLTDAIRLEAELVAGRIRKLIRGQKVTDKKTGELRNTKYSDIVILLRSFGKYADTFLEVLEQKGIPAHASSKTGYFKTQEIQTVLSLLRILDNPRQDIPLAAVLRSPMGGFTDEEMAILKASGKKRAFHLCVLEPEEDAISSELFEKVKGFLAMVSHFRDLVPKLPIHELLSRILEETGYLYYVSAMPGGVRRRGNIEMLLEKAVAYEQSSYRGLFHFIRYMDKLQKYEVDYGEADIVNENANAVRLMTIHKSKGLEFPIVFLCGTSKKFNRQDVRSSMVIHPDLGVGVDYMDPKVRVCGATLYKKVVAKQIDLENQGEELRVLYVALTRAKEKLIVTGTGKKIEETIEKLRTRVSKEQKVLPLLERTKASCFLDWILPAVIAYEDKYPIHIWDEGELVTEEVESQLEETEGLGALLYQVTKRDEQTDAYVREQLSYEYPYGIETSRKTKYSVSELKHRSMDAMYEEEEQEVIAAAGEIQDSYISQSVEEEERSTAVEDMKDSYIPRFAGGEQEVNQGALRGSAMHRAVECLSIERLAGSENLQQDLEEEIKRIVAEGRLTEEMEALLRREKLMKFYESKLALRMKNAALQQELYRERPFVMGKSADEIEQDGSDTMVLIQGIMDAFFVEDGEIVLLDYKTDVVKSEEELVKRYKEQLDLYQEALERNLRKPVKEKLIYSFYLDKTLVV